MKKTFVIFIFCIFVLTLLNSCMLTFNFEGTEDLMKDETVVLKVSPTISITRVNDKVVDYCSDFWDNSYEVILFPGHHIFGVSYRSGNYHSVGMHKVEYTFEKGKRYKLTAKRNYKEKIVEYDIIEY